MYGGAHLHVVVAVDAEHILDYIAWTLDVDAVCGHAQLGFLAVGGGDFYLERTEYGVDGLVGDILAYESAGIVVGECHFKRAYGGGVYVDRLTAYLTSGELLYHDGCELEGVDGDVGVGAAFVAEGCVGLQALPARCLAH